MNPTYYALDEKSALSYVVDSKLATDYFEAGEKLCCRDLADGNINLVFRVSSVAEPLKRSVIVKQALPHSRRYPDFKMPVTRAELEFNVLKNEGELCPGLVPKVFLYDDKMYLLVMEDLNRHVIMREGIQTQTVYPNFIKDTGDFLAATLFFNSDLYLDSAEKKARQKQFINPVLCKVTEDLYFTFPFVEHPTNRYNPAVKSYAQRIQSDGALRAEAMELKWRFMNNAESLLHGDLHTGSIMLNESNTKIIDPEFAFYGPMAFDIGSLFGNLVIAHAAQNYYASDKSSRDTYQLWLRNSVKEIWTTFEAQFRSHWDSKSLEEWKNPEYQDTFMRKVLRESAGFAGCEIFRRTIGMAQVLDIENIKDPIQQGNVVLCALKTGEKWLRNWKSFSAIEEIVDEIADE